MTFAPSFDARLNRIIEWVRAMVRGRPSRLLLVGISGLFMVAALGACDRPVEGRPPDIAGVEAHLDLMIGYMPERCEPVGLGGDGRGTMVGAGFDCPDGATLRIQRIDAELIDDPVPASPAETAPGRVEWRDESSGDVIRVDSDALDSDALVRVAESIEVR